MDQKISTSGELTFSAAILSAFICILFGANAVAIKISLSGLGFLQQSAFVSVLLQLQFFYGLKSQENPLP